MQPLVIITDMTAHGDDSIAISLLASSATVSIQSIIATSGNVWAEEAAANVRHLLRKLRRTDISVTVGQSAADFCARRPAYHKNLAELTAVYRGAFERQPPDGAVPARIDLADAFTHDGARPDVLLIGPATVFAEALQRDPDLPNQIGQVFVMGGAIDRIGNATPKAEFNFWFDPEAAETLLSSTVPITLLPLDTVRGLFYPSSFAGYLPAKLPGADHLRECLSLRTHLPVCDEALAATVINPRLVTRRRLLKLRTETGAGSTYGAVAILPDDAPRRAVEVIDAIDMPALWMLLQEGLAVNAAATPPTLI